MMPIETNPPPGMPPDIVELWEERIAIMVVDGGKTDEEATAEATVDMRRVWKERKRHEHKG